MRRIVANVALTEKEVDTRLGQLRTAFPNHQFESLPHETRQQIVVDSESQIDTPDFESMVRVATTGVA